MVKVCKRKTLGLGLKRDWVKTTSRELKECRLSDQAKKTLEERGGDQTQRTPKTFFGARKGSLDQGKSGLLCTIGVLIKRGKTAITSLKSPPKENTREKRPLEEGGRDKAVHLKVIDTGLWKRGGENIV